MMIDIKREEDFSLSFSAKGAGVKDIGYFYMCPYVPPFIEELFAVCPVRITINDNLTYSVHMEDAFHFVGRNYFVIHESDADIYDLKITVSINRHLSLGATTEYKMDGEAPLYLVSHL